MALRGGGGRQYPCALASDAFDPNRAGTSSSCNRSVDLPTNDAAVSGCLTLLRIASESLISHRFAPQVRERALRVMSAAYRQMPVASAERMLKLPSGGDALGAGLRSLTPLCALRPFCCGCMLLSCRGWWPINTLMWSAAACRCLRSLLLLPWRTGAIVAIAAVQEGCTPGLKLASQNLLSGVKVGDLTFAK